VTITMGVLLLAMVAFAVKHKGADAPQMCLGVMLGVISTDGSLVHTLATTGIDVLNQIVNTISSALGQGSIV
jgi:hypothetical protein